MDFNGSYWESLTLEYDWVWVQPLKTRNHWELRVSDASWDTAAVIANVDRPSDRIFVKEIWLVVGPYPSEEYDFVSWDDDIPIYYGKNQTLQTTNQFCCWLLSNTILIYMKLWFWSWSAAFSKAHNPHCQMVHPSRVHTVKSKTLSIWWESSSRSVSSQFLWQTTCPKRRLIRWMNMGDRVSKHLRQLGSSTVWEKRNHQPVLNVHSISTA